MIWRPTDWEGFRFLLLAKIRRKDSAFDTARSCIDAAADTMLKAAFKDLEENFLSESAAKALKDRWGL